MIFQKKNGQLIVSVTQFLGPLFQGKVSMYAKYDPNSLILSQGIERKPILGINQGPLTLLKLI